MRRPGVRAAAVIVLLAITGCAHTVDLAPPPAAVPDVRGTWTGTWGGSPVRLVIAEQAELGDYSGLYFGPVQLLGRRRPSVSGVLTSTVAGAPVSVSAQGWLGHGNGRLTLRLEATTPDGAQQLTLTRTADDRWSGRGESSFAWGPNGPVEIAR